MAGEPNPQLKLLATLEGARPSAYAPIAFSPDGRILAWGDHVKKENEPIRGSVKLWDVDQRKVLATLRDSAGDCDYGVEGVAFSPDGKTLASRCRGEVKLWDVATRKEKALLKGDPKLRGFLAFSPDGKTIASASDDGKTAILWDLSTVKEKASLKGLPEVVMSVAFSPDGKLFAAGGGRFGSEGRPGAGEVKLWDVATGRERATLGRTVKLKVTLRSLSYLKAEGMPKRVLLKLTALNGKEFPTEEDVDKELPKILDTILDKEQREKYGKLVQSQIDSLREGPEVVWSVAFSPDGKMLTSGSVLGSVLLWDVKTGKRTATLQRFNPKGREEDINPCYSVAFSPDGNTLAAGTLYGIKLWDVKSGENIVALGDPPGTVWSVAFSSDGKTVASAGSKGVIGKRDRREGDPTLRLWEWVPTTKTDK